MFGSKILAGALGGLAWSLSGFSKAQGQSFDVVQFGKSVLLGLLVGVVGEELNIPFDTVSGFFLSAGLTALLENGLKGLVRRLSAFLASKNAAPAPNPAPAVPA